MDSYLLIETRTARDGGEVRDFLELAATLASAGNTVDLYLVQNGVLMARSQAEPRMADLLHLPGLTVWADDFSMASRCLGSHHLLERVRIGGAATMVELLTRAGCKAIWH